MGYTPERFGAMRVGDFIDALIGFDEHESERIKCIAELVRTSTTILRNAHVFYESDLKTAEELWPFPWEVKQAETLSCEVREALEKNADKQAEYLMQKHGNGNNKSKSQIRG